VTAGILELVLTEKWKTDNEVGEHKGSRTVEAIGAFLDVKRSILEIGRNVGDSHEAHECSAKEDCIRE
jgi:hypothetical protein